jgi:hypothetical protein
VRTITSESWGVFDSHSTDAPLSISLCTVMVTLPHNDKKLQDWDTPNQEQINKLKAESQKTKPQLANHDHQVLIQTEPDDNVKDSIQSPPCRRNLLYIPMHNSDTNVSIKINTSKCQELLF